MEGEKTIGENGEGGVDTGEKNTKMPERGILYIRER